MYEAPPPRHAAGLTIYPSYIKTDSHHNLQEPSEGKFNLRLSRIEKSETSITQLLRSSSLKFSQMSRVLKCKNAPLTSKLSQISAETAAVSRKPHV